MEDSIIVKRSIHGPDFLVTQLILGPDHIAIKNQVLGLEEISPRAFSFLRRYPTGESLGRVNCVLPMMRTMRKKGKDISGTRTC